MLYEMLPQENRALLDGLLPTYRLMGKELELARAWCLNVLQLHAGPERTRHTEDEIRDVVTK